jgi:hypothetical protein
MAIVYAVKTGNWSDTTVWNTGALPTSADDVYSNTFTVTINISPTVLSISNQATTGVSGGGTFLPTNGNTLTCTGSGIVASGKVITSSLSANQTFNYVGNISTNFVSGAIGIEHSGDGTISITGNCITTQLSGADNNRAVINLGGGTINITGNCTGGGSSSSALVSYYSVAAMNSGTGVINITGTVTGGSGDYRGIGAMNTGTGTMKHIGAVQATAAGPAIGIGSANQVTILSGPFLTVPSGMNSVMALRWMWASSNVTPTYYQIRTVDLATIRPLYTADSVGGNPATSNVRSGTAYGPANELTGICAVPAAGSVALGVPVDNTTGSAILTTGNIRSAFSVELDRLVNCSTVATTGQQIQDALS